MPVGELDQDRLAGKADRRQRRDELAGPDGSVKSGGRPVHRLFTTAGLRSRSALA